MDKSFSNHSEEIIRYLDETFIQPDPVLEDFVSAGAAVE